MQSERVDHCIHMLIMFCSAVSLPMFVSEFLLLSLRLLLLVQQLVWSLYMLLSGSISTSDIFPTIQHVTYIILLHL